MALLRTVLIMEIAISMMLWLAGIPSSGFSYIAGMIGVNTGTSIPNITNNYTGGVIGQSSYPVSDYYGLSIPSNIIGFGIFGVTIGVALIIALFAGFSTIFIIPALIAIGLMWLFSPITTISNNMLGDPAFAPLGLIIEIFFLAMALLGLFDFISGRES